MADCRHCVDFEWCAEHEDCGLFKPKQKQTNADRIRAMTDEELVDEYFYILHKVFPRYTDSRQGLLHYLKQEATNDP